jgi:hypothetical protein
MGLNLKERSSGRQKGRSLRTKHNDTRAAAMNA